jgi:hypothetical protein
MLASPLFFKHTDRHIDMFLNTQQWTTFLGEMNNFLG